MSSPRSDIDALISDAKIEFIQSLMKNYNRLLELVIKDNLPVLKRELPNQVDQITEWENAAHQDLGKISVTIMQCADAFEKALINWHKKQIFTLNKDFLSSLKDLYDTCDALQDKLQTQLESILPNPSKGHDITTYFGIFGLKALEQAEEQYLKPLFITTALHFCNDYKLHLVNKSVAQNSLETFNQEKMDLVLDLMNQLERGQSTQVMQTILNDAEESKTNFKTTVSQHSSIFTKFKKSTDAEAFLQNMHQAAQTHQQGLISLRHIIQGSTPDVRAAAAQKR